MIKIFLDYVEIRTKIATVIPYFSALLIYILYFNEPINIQTAIIFFIALLLLDMSATAINNYISLTKAERKNDLDNRFLEYINNGTISHNSLKYVLIIMIVCGISLSIYLVYLTNIYVLLLGLLCGFIALVYSYGPLPIFRTPLGEIFSGTCDGFIIPLIFIYTQTSEYIVKFNGYVISIDLLELIQFVLVFMPLYLLISNIMLANNICDREEDIENERYTLPVILGKKNSIILFNFKYYLSISIIVLLSIINVFPLYFILIIFVIVPLTKNLKEFNKIQIKSKTFKYSLKNFLIISLTYMLLIVFAICLQ